MNKHGLFYKMIQYDILTRGKSVSDVWKVSNMVTISLVINWSGDGSVIVSEHVYWLGDVVIWKVTFFESLKLSGFDMKYFCNWIE